MWVTEGKVFWPSFQSLGVQVSQGFGISGVERFWDAGLHG